MPSNLLIDGPIEVLYEVCSHLKSVQDIESLALIPEICGRMKEFVRIVTNNPENIVYIPEAFHDFPHGSLKENAREYTINLCEIDANSRQLPIEQLKTHFLSRKHIQNFFIMVNYDFDDYEDDMLTISPQVSRDLAPFSEKFVYVITSNYAETGYSSLDIEHVEAVRLEELTYKEIRSSAESWTKLKTRKLIMDQCEETFVHSFDYETLEVENLVIICGIPSTGIEIDEYYPSVFINQAFSNIKTLELNVMNCLKEVYLPQAEKISLAISGRASMNKLIVPLIQGLYAPKCTAFSVVINMALPEVSNVEMPILEKLSIRVSRLKFDADGVYFENDLDQEADWFSPHYFVDLEESFGMTEEEMYGTSTGMQRKAINTIHGWPRSKEVLIDGCLKRLAGDEEFLRSESMELSFNGIDWVEKLSTKPLKRPEVTRITLSGREELDQEFQGCMRPDPELRDGLTSPSSSESVFPQRYIESGNVKEMRVWRDFTAQFPIDYEDISQRFPLLETLEVWGRTHDDVLMTDGGLVNLKTLKLYNITTRSHVQLLSSLKESPVETLILGKYFPPDDGPDSKQTVSNLLLDIDGLTVFRDTLKSITAEYLRFMTPAKSTGGPRVPGILEQGYLELVDLPLLEEVRVDRVAGVAVQGCPLLKGVHIKDRNETTGWSFVPLESFTCGNGTYSLSLR